MTERFDRRVSIGATMGRDVESPQSPMAGLLGAAVGRLHDTQGLYHVGHRSNSSTAVSTASVTPYMTPYMSQSVTPLQGSSPSAILKGSVAILTGRLLTLDINPMIILHTKP